MYLVQVSITTLVENLSVCLKIEVKYVGLRSVDVRENYILKVESLPCQQHTLCVCTQTGTFIYRHSHAHTHIHVFTEGMIFTAYYSDIFDCCTCLP